MSIYKNFLRWKRDLSDAITSDPEVIQNIVNNEVFVTEITNNEEFITQLVENNTYITEHTTIVNAVINGKKGIANELATLDSTGKVTASQLPPAVINFTLDGAGVVITTGLKGFVTVPFNCTINSWDILPDVSGSIVIDIWRDTFANHPPTDADSITGSAPPTLTTATKATSSTLTGWTTQLNQGDILAFNVDSATSVKLVTLSLRISHR